MSFRYNADQILEMALEIERSGARFYRRAAESKQDSRSRAMLLELAAMEDDHERVFADMRQGLTDDERKETTYDPQGELPLYLAAMADKQVFQAKPSPADRLTGRESAAEVLRIAIGLEKDSIVFYLGLQELVPERLGRERIDGIVKEEFGHIGTLGDLLRCVGA